jgi:hypothetical protein
MSPAVTTIGITATTDTTIHLLVARRVQLGHVAAADRDDLQQHLRKELLRRAHRYQPSAGAWSTFARRVLDAELKRWLRHHHRVCRDLRVARSIHGEDGAQLAAWAAGIPASDAGDGIAQQTLRADVSSVISALPLGERLVAEALMALRPSEVARRLGCRTLEGADEFRRRFAIGGPINPKTNRPFGQDTKAYAEWAATVGKPAISQDTADLCDQLAEAVSNHAEAAALLAEGKAEGVVRAEYGGLASQIRIDWTHPERGIVDLKTIDDLDWFEAQARSFAYAHQLSFYRAILAAVSGRNAEVQVIAVEKKEPFRVGVWRFSDQVLDAAARENLAAIERLKICRAQDRWPTGYEAIRSFDYLG